MVTVDGIRRQLRAGGSRSALILLGAALLFGCGRSSKDGGDDDVTSSSGAGGDAGTGGSTGGTGGASSGGTSGAGGTGTGGASTGGASGTGGTGTGGGAGAGISGTGGTSATGGASGTGGTAGKADCSALSDAYASAVVQVELCDPEAAIDPCTKRIGVGLECGQDEFVNADAAEALAALQAASDAYTAGECRQPVLCGASANPIGANCSAAGKCETVYDNGGTGCKVNGKVYAHGTDGIPAPDGCNTCECSDGSLICTEAGCMNETLCPDGTADGTQCALCGPTDACQVVEYGCFQMCTQTDDCADPSALCLSSSCVTGICG